MRYRADNDKDSEAKDIFKALDQNDEWVAQAART
jgi:hypothetical protein